MLDLLKLQRCQYYISFPGRLLSIACVRYATLAVSFAWSDDARRSYELDSWTCFLTFMELVSSQDGDQVVNSGPFLCVRRAITSVFRWLAFYKTLGFKGINSALKVQH